MKYHLGPDFLDFNNIGTITKFSVGNQPVRNLLVIERHYFRKKLVKSFEFKFDFCIPNSINNWETIYNIPELDNDIKQEKGVKFNNIEPSFINFKINFLYFIR